MAKSSAEEIKALLEIWLQNNPNISEIYTDWEDWCDDEGDSGLKFSVHVTNYNEVTDRKYIEEYVEDVLKLISLNDLVDSFGSQEIVIENPFHKEWLESQLKGNNKHVKGRLKI